MRSAAALFVVGACGGTSEPPAPDAPVQHALDRECISGVTAGDIIPSLIGDELFVAYGCAGQFGESFGLEATRATFVGNLACCDFGFHFDVLRMQTTGPIALQEDRRGVIRFQPAWPQTRFAHVLDDAWMLDMNGDGRIDYVTVADGAIKRGPEVTSYQSSIDPSTEVTLLAGKPFRYGAVADFAGSALPDIFYVTATGELGIAIQTDPDVFADQPLGSDPGTPKRLSVGDLDGDGRADVVGAAGHVFVYSSKRQALAMLDDDAHVIVVGEIDTDTKLDALYISADRSEVRRVIVGDDGTLASKRLLAAGGDAMALGDFDHDYRSDVALVRDRGQPTSWIEMWRAYYFEY